MPQPMNDSTSAPAVDPSLFRKALGTFATGVTVVTTSGVAGEDIGLTANSFNSVSLDPPMILWSLARASLSLAAFKAAEHFAVHILGEDQEDISSRFARRGEDKFAGVELARGPSGIPMMTNFAARFVCRTAYQYEGGDHIIFVGEVVEFDQRARPPLLFHGGQYGQLTRPENSGSREAETLQGGYLGDLLRRAYRRVYAPVQVELDRRQLSVPQYFFLSRIARENQPTAQRLRELLEAAGRYPTASEIEALVERDLIAREGDLFALTGAGVACNLELASVVMSAETDAEQSLDYELRQTLKVALECLAIPD